MTGVFFGVASSAIAAVHSVVIKQSLNVVNGSALALSWYSNVLSAILLVPIILVVGEVPAITELLFGLDELLRPEDTITPLTTFLWGSLITVSPDIRPGTISHKLYDVRVSLVFS